MIREFRMILITPFDILFIESRCSECDLRILDGSYGCPFTLPFIGSKWCDHD